MKSLEKKDRETSLDRWFRKNPLSIKDDLFLHKSILRSLLADVNRLRPGTKGLERDIVTLEARIEHEGVSFLATALCSLGKALDRGLSSGTFICPIGFKTAKGLKNPLLLKGIFDDVFDPVTGDLVKGRDCLEDISILRQLLFFLEEVRTANEFGQTARVKGFTVLHEMR